MKRELNTTHRKAVTVSIVILFTILVLVVVVYIGKPLLQLAGEPEVFRDWIDARGWYGWILFVLIMIVQVFVAFIPGEALEIAAGYAFGALEGSILCLVGEALGGILVFLFIKHFGVKAAELFFSLEKLRSLRFLQNPKKRDILFFLLFLLPGTPKDLLCYFAGLTEISTASWICIQLLGRIPSILTSTLGGDALGSEKYWIAAIVLTATAVISWLGLAVYHRFSSQENQKHDREQQK